MKRGVVILALLLCLSACGGSVPAERGTASGSAAIQAGPSSGLRGAQLLGGGPLTDGLQTDAW